MALRYYMKTHHSVEITCMMLSCHISMLGDLIRWRKQFTCTMR